MAEKPQTILAALTPHRAEFQKGLEAILRMTALDNVGRLRSPRQAVLAAEPLTDLWLAVLAGTAGEMEIEALVTDLVQKGLVYTTGASLMQSIRETTLSLLDERADLLGQGVAICDTFSKRFLEEIATQREVLISRDQEQYQSSLQQTLHTRLENEKVLAEKLRRHQRHLQTVLKIDAAIAPLTGETEILTRFVHLTHNLFDLTGAAVFEVAGETRLAVLRAAAGQIPPAIQVYVETGRTLTGNLAQAFDEDRLMFSQLTAAPAGLHQEVLVPFGMTADRSGILALWAGDDAFGEDELEFINPLMMALSAAWRRAFLLAQTEERARELELLHGRRIRELWQLSDASRAGYVYDGLAVRPQAVAGDALDKETDYHILPFTSRDITLGRLAIPKSEGVDLLPEDLAFVEAMLREMVSALENAELLRGTQRQARREETIRQITERMRAAGSLGELIRVTASELGERLSAGHALLEMGIEAEVSARPQQTTPSNGTHHHDPGSSGNDRQAT